MPYKDADKQRDAQNKWYADNKKRESRIRAKRKKEIKEWYREYKKQFSCSRCEENHPACIDFHHINSREKEAGVSYGLTNGYSKKRIEREIKKCMPLCSNCHRKLHYEEKYGPAKI